MTIIGFTGTQMGMTLSQMAEFNYFLDSTDPSSFHHGGCIGADAQAHRFAQHLKLRTEVYPGVNKDGEPAKRGVFKNPSVVHPEKFYLDRNKDIVDAAEVIIATPKEADEQLRGGTWYTIRYAREQGKIIAIILPDGTITT